MLVCVIVAQSCRHHGTDATPAVYAWMLCQECVAQEEARVTALGDAAVPVLRDILLHGPPPEHIALLRTSVGLATSARTATMTATDSAARERTVDNVIASYRRRSADALGTIGTRDAHRALCAARSVPALQPRVTLAIDSALARGGGGCP